ncbi:hypothetical protein HPP92_011920 [Vanilla planifolia]|uniref:Uncharacterized protein n=1 Tax=Vanilla planifolia TaxID=51239 RepID=A0A835R7Z9_VANPL|nr:hypothetical protein HPP92_011920 [Vanilla planifolia]
MWEAGVGWVEEDRVPGEQIGGIIDAEIWEILSRVELLSECFRRLSVPCYGGAKGQWSANVRCLFMGVHCFDMERGLCHDTTNKDVQDLLHQTCQKNSQIHKYLITQLANVRQSREKARAPRPTSRFRLGARKAGRAGRVRRLEADYKWWPSSHVSFRKDSQWWWEWELRMMTHSSGQWWLWLK